MCDYCEYDRDGYISTFGKNGHVVLNPYKAELKVSYYGNQLNISIKYCPMCGRELKEK